jgi:hypothetical protein
VAALYSSKTSASTDETAWYQNPKDHNRNFLSPNWIATHDPEADKLFQLLVFISVCATVTEVIIWHSQVQMDQH